MNRYKGKTALVTGASSGIGEAFARVLAGRGMHLILVARSADKLEQLADELRGRHGVQVTVLPTDLGAAGAVGRLFTAVTQRGLAVDLLVNNAGFATYGRFEENAAARDSEQVAVNVAALVELTHAFIPGMLARGGGSVINVSSTVSFQPTPYMAVYGASKAFVTSFSAALAEEYRGRGLRVLALCPGATATNFFEVAGNEWMAGGAMRSSEQVVATALRALARGRSVVVDGPTNWLMAVIAKRLSFALGARLAGLITRPRQAKPEQAKLPAQG